MNLTERFLKYVSFDTQSDELTRLTPSTPDKWFLPNTSKRSLNRWDCKRWNWMKMAICFATLPANTDKEVPTIGFISHMDTSPRYVGQNVSPRIVQNYDGSDIVLCAEENIVCRLHSSPIAKP